MGGRRLISVRSEVQIFPGPFVKRGGTVSYGASPAGPCPSDARTDLPGGSHAPKPATGIIGADEVDIPGFASGPAGLLHPSLLIPITLSMAIAFGLSLPIAWLYTWTRQGKKYSASFAQTLVILPIAIALVVFLVKGSLARPCCMARSGGQIPRSPERDSRHFVAVRHPE